MVINDNKLQYYISQTNQLLEEPESKKEGEEASDGKLRNEGHFLCSRTHCCNLRFCSPYFPVRLSSIYSSLLPFERLPR